MLPNVLPNERTIHCGSLVLSLDGFSVTVGEQDIPLTRAEFLILAQLARHPLSVLDRHTLSEVLLRSEVAPGCPSPSVTALNVHVCRLRQKLRSAGVDCIKTMKYVGYRFVPPEPALEHGGPDNDLSVY